jgi:hypothetical protein
VAVLPLQEQAAAALQLLQEEEARSAAVQTAAGLLLLWLGRVALLRQRMAVPGQAVC